MISQHCAFHGGMNIIDDLKLIYNYKFTTDYKLALVSFNDEIKNTNIEELKEKKKQFVSKNIQDIRKLFHNIIIPDLNKDNIKSLQTNNLKILKGSTRILRCKNYLCGEEMLSIMSRLSLKGIAGIISSTAKIYFISKNMKSIVSKYKVDYFEIDNQGITIV